MILVAYIPNRRLPVHYSLHAGTVGTLNMSEHKCKQKIYNDLKSHFCNQFNSANLFFRYSGTADTITYARHFGSTLDMNEYTNTFKCNVGVKPEEINSGCGEGIH